MAEDLDPSEAEPFRRAINTALEQQPPPGAEGKPAVVTGWVMVVECIDGDGKYWLFTEAHEATTSWSAEGMMQWAIRANNEVEPDD